MMVRISVTTPTYTYRGGPPSSSYQIVINKTPVDLGDAATPLAQPSFKNTLSAGDRSTLALAFFLAQLEQDPGRAQKIVVLDDPFTSQDEFRRLNTIFEIKRLGADVTQVVLLSHDPHFLKQLWDRLQPDERKTIRLGRVGPENTAIVSWDIEEALKTVHRANIEALLAFHNMAEGNPREAVLKMRTVLETHCLYLYPTLFDGVDTLGVIVGKIRNAGATHPLFGIYAELDEINEYSKRYHHGENPGAALEAIDDAALKGFVRRTLICVGGFEA